MKCPVCKDGNITPDESVFSKEDNAEFCDLCHSFFWNGTLAPTTIEIGYCPVDKAFVLQVKCGAYTIYEMTDEDLSEFFLRTATEVTEYYLKNSKEISHHTYWRVPRSKESVRK